MIEVKEIKETDDGGAVIVLEADMPTILKFAEAGVLKLLMDSLLELEEINGD